MDTRCIGCQTVLLKSQETEHTKITTIAKHTAEVRIYSIECHNCGLVNYYQEIKLTP